MSGKYIQKAQVPLRWVVRPAPVGRNHADELATAGDQRRRLDGCDARLQVISQVLAAGQEVAGGYVGDDDTLLCSQGHAAGALRGWADPLPEARCLGRETAEAE